MMPKRTLRQITIGKRAIHAKAIGYMKPDIDPNTRLYVPFNEGVGALAKDYSQYGNHAVLTDVEWGIGLNGNAGKFNGVSSYGNCGNHASLDITNVINLEIWANIASLSRVNPLVGKWNGDYAHTQFYMEVHSNNKLRANFGDGALLFHRKTTISSIPTGWHRFAAVIKGYEDIDLYLDGDNLYGTYDGTATSIYSDLTDLTIGKQSVSFFSGTIALVIIKALAESAAQIAADCYEVCN